MHVLAALAAVALAAWLYLALAHGGYWRTDQRLPQVHGDPPRWPDVAAIVPARDEAAILPETLPSLLAQDYPGDLRVILVDDGSRDGTAEAAKRLAAGSPRALRIVRGVEPPAGWAGKVWAMTQGVEAAGMPAYLLLTDADIAHRPGSLTALVRAAELDGRALVSQMASLRAESFWERAVVPAFVYFFATLYPFRRVNRPGARTAAAAGGCVLVRREALERAGGLAAIKGALIDDVALGRLVKRAGDRTWLGLATGVVSRRPYPRLADLWTMIARSAYTQLRHSPLMLVGTVVGMLLLYAAPPAAALSGVGTFAAGATTGAAAWAAALGFAAWGVMAATYVPMLRLYGLGAWRAPTLPLLALLYVAMTVDSARRHRVGLGGAWKGRTPVSSRPRSPARERMGR
ncbi:MAG: glycosyltransferase [Streptosporangiaceae bacterium]